jgi:hypothetical protein
MIVYFRGRWPDSKVPDGGPLWLYYEVDDEADIVLRTVDVFQDGRIERNSIELEQRNGDICTSLVDGPFIETVQQAGLQPTTHDAFEGLWALGKNTPFWVPAGS